MRGSIVKRGKNSWALVVYLGRDPQNGREKQKWYSHRTRREAEAHLNQILSAIQGGSWTPPNTKLRFADYLERWLTDYAVGAVRSTTLESYRMIVRKHILPTLGHVPLTALSPQAIQGYFSSRLQGKRDEQGLWVQRPLSPTTVRHHGMLLHEALRHAVRWGLRASNPTDMVDVPRNRQAEMRVLDEEQVRLFLAEARRSSPHYRLYLAAVMTGMRQGELLGQRWRDLDLTRGTASVQQIFYRLGSQQLFKEPKSAKARRTVALPLVLVEELRALRKEQDERRGLLGELYQDNGLVFCQANGKPLHANDIRRGDFRRVLKRAGLPQIRFHDLRHCHATLLLQQGANPKVVQERLGHSTPAFTLAIYGHVLPGMQEEAARTLEERLFGGLAAR
jgi:integrase